MTSETKSNGRASDLGRQNRHGRDLVYWLPLGIGTGVALGAALDNLALGIAMGAAAVAVIGMTANPGRMSAAGLDTGTPGGRLIAGIAVGGVVCLAVGAMVLFFLTH